MTFELLAPARNADTGIAAIDCGADAVYIAGPAFGARQAAGNEVKDIERLCSYAHRFGARIFVTVNTIIFEEELPQVASLLEDLSRAGADALIVQDLGVAELCRRCGVTLPLHASTQCAIRTPEEARTYESLGFSRLVLERQLSLEEIRRIREAVDCELECFVHGALCVCYSGNCYLSQALAGRSANRGACVQACRSRYDLTDASGKVLVRDKALLSLKDLNLSGRLQDLAGAGICSFKIEGRLKNESYVRNIVREYSLAMDALGLERASWGRVGGCFTPRPEKTFNRGYTTLYLDGKRGKWAAMDIPKSLGEYVGTVSEVFPGGFALSRAEGVVLSNGDGFTFACEGEVKGVRGDVCSGDKVYCKAVPGLRPGLKIFRNISSEFEKDISRAPGVRRLGVSVNLGISSLEDKYIIDAEAVSEDGRKVALRLEESFETAGDIYRTEGMIREGLSKNALHYAFSARNISHSGELPLLRAAWINGLRRSLAEKLDALPCKHKPLLSRPLPSSLHTGTSATYKQNVANSLAASAYEGAEKAYELSPSADAELMRSRYCIRYELGLCPRHHGSGDNSPLLLRQGSRSLTLRFDCARCEMTVSKS